MNCRHCGRPLSLSLVDLATAPPSNAYLKAGDLSGPEMWFPLRVFVCDGCWLAQTDDMTGADALFSAEYAYFSSFSSTWNEHARGYVETMAANLALGPDSYVVEVASNDGYLLTHVRARGIPCLGIEPTASTAAAARGKGVPTIERFFGAELATELARDGRGADLMVANNVLAHVPDINDFVRGFAILLKPAGLATFEFPHLLTLMADAQFDTVYHEHFSYLSLIAVRSIFASQGLVVVDVEQLSTHGGSLRVHARRADHAGDIPVSQRVTAMIDAELAAGLAQPGAYADFQARAEKIKNDCLAFLIDCRRRGRKVAAYGAAAKGNTLLNFAGVRSDLLPYVVDRNPAKIGCFLPGSRVPIVAEEYLRNDRPDLIVILPWNLTTEVVRQLSYAKGWGARFVRFVPSLEIFD